MYKHTCTSNLSENNHRDGPMGHKNIEVAVINML